MRDTEKNKKAMLAALESSLGIVSRAVKKCKVSRATHYLWMREDPNYKIKVQEISEIALDFAEDSLIQQIDEKNTSATIFYLKTKGKSRGYVERIETIDKTAEHNELKDKSDSELLDMISEIKGKLSQ